MPPLLARGDVVLTPFPFTDSKGAPLRPALVVSRVPIGRDVVLAGISSVVHGSSVPTDYLVSTSHAESLQTGLRVASVFRMHKLVTVEETVVVRRLGRIGPLLQLETDKL